MQATTDQGVARDAELQRLHLGVFRYLRMHGAAPAEADDLTQQAFVVAVQRGGLLLEPAASAAFLRRTARFLFLRARRDAKHHRDLADAVDELWARDCARDDGDALLAAARRCVEQLQGRARRAVELGYGFGGDETRGRAAIARELGMQENGVKTLMQRVRKLLRACIERSHR
jgi:DNA-directed RNA polymerase specialized sigma24 family protein